MTVDREQTRRDAEAIADEVIFGHLGKFPTDVAVSVLREVLVLAASRGLSRSLAELEQAERERTSAVASMDAEHRARVQAERERDAWKVEAELRRERKVALAAAEARLVLADTLAKASRAYVEAEDDDPGWGKKEKLYYEALAAYEQEQKP